MAQLLSNMNTAVLKLPLGMIRIIEFPMAILAFATTSGFSASGTISVICPQNQTKTIPIDFGYSFGMDGETTDICDPSLTTKLSIFPESVKSSAEFFVFTGVMSFLYVLAILAVYSLFWTLYENDSRFAMGDFIGTAVLALFWFAGSCAWASGVSSLKTETSITAILSRLSPICNKYKCTPTENWNYASLNVSLIAGFACVGLWVANLWFIYKETAWFKARSGGAAGGLQPGMPPNVGTPTTPGSQPTYR